MAPVSSSQMWNSRLPIRPLLACVGASPWVVLWQLAEVEQLLSKGFPPVLLSCHFFDPCARDGSLLLQLFCFCCCCCCCCCCCPCFHCHGCHHHWFACAFCHFWVAGFLSSKSGIYDTDRKPGELTILSFLWFRDPQLFCLLLSTLQSPVFILYMVPRVLGCSQWEEQGNVLLLYLPRSFRSLCMNLIISPDFQHVFEFKIKFKFNFNPT